MKRRRWLSVRGLIALGVLALPAQVTGAGLEWQVQRQASLETRPLDVAASTDGEWLFVLTPGQVQAYSSGDGEVKARIPVDRSYDRLAYSARNNALVLTSTTGKTLQVIRLEVVHDIDTAQLPSKGPENAPVTIAFFSDYQ